MALDLEQFCQNTKLTKKNGGLNVSDMKKILGSKQSKDKNRTELIKDIVNLHCKKNAKNHSKFCNNPTLTASKGGLNVEEMRKIIGVTKGKRSDIVDEVVAKICQNSIIPAPNIVLRPKGIPTTLLKQMKNFGTTKIPQNPKIIVGPSYLVKLKKDDHIIYVFGERHSLKRKCGPKSTPFHVFMRDWLQREKVDLYIEARIRSEDLSFEPFVKGCSMSELVQYMRPYFPRNFEPAKNHAILDYLRTLLPSIKGRVHDVDMRPNLEDLTTQKVKEINWATFCQDGGIYKAFETYIFKYPVVVKELKNSSLTYFERKKLKRIAFENYNHSYSLCDARALKTMTQFEILEYKKVASIVFFAAILDIYAVARMSKVYSYPVKVFYGGSGHSEVIVKMFKALGYKSVGSPIITTNKQDEKKGCFEYNANFFK